jgi:5S rRNA maturation endonuclease (ribonuclease M5)
MGFCTLHFQKATQPIRGNLGNHIDRIPGKEYSYRHADLSLTKNNKALRADYNKYVSKPYNEAIKARVEDGYKSKKALRKDAIYSVNTMLTGSHEELTEIAQDPKKLNAWIKANLEWCETTFGRDNIVRFNVHLDEKTPHIHCVWCPITEDGRLSAQEWIGNSKKLEALQSSYAEKMKTFGLERGISSDKKHVDTEEWRRERALNIQSGEKLKEKVDSISKSNILFGLDTLKKELKTAIDSTIIATRSDAQQELIAINRDLARDNEKLIKEGKKLLQDIEGRDPIERKYIPNEDVEYIINNSDVVDYFLHLSQRGYINFECKKGKEYIFTSSDKSMKISASKKGWRDFKANEGGQIVKAVMKYERMTWLEAIHFLNEFQGRKVEFEEIKAKIKEETPELSPDDRKVTYITRPNNPELIEYFKKRGISYDTLAEFTQQIHFQHGDKHLFGIGNKNFSGGYDIRMPFESNGKSKVGVSDFTMIAKNREKSKNIIIFEGMTNMLSMIEILKAQGRDLEEYSFVSLNSTSNTERLIPQLQRADKSKYTNIICLLDGDPSGEEATQKILQAVPEAKDLREYFNIGKGEKQYNDLNDYLVKGIAFKEKQEEKKSKGLKVK